MLFMSADIRRGPSEVSQRADLTANPIASSENRVKAALTRAIGARINYGQPNVLFITLLTMFVATAFPSVDPLGAPRPG